jgi:hypothetical protein
MSRNWRQISLSASLFASPATALLVPQAYGTKSRARRGYSEIALQAINGERSVCRPLDYPGPYSAFSATFEVIFP